MVNGDAALTPEVYAVAMVIVAGVYTAVVAGAFLLLGQYFRSEKVKKAVALQDQQLER
jgi:hypothetical protein